MQLLLNQNFQSIEDTANYLLETYPVKQIALALAERMLVEKQTEPIVVSQEQLDNLMSTVNALFKVRGIRADGTKESRGRKPKEA